MTLYGAQKASLKRSRWSDEVVKLCYNKRNMEGYKLSNLIIMKAHTSPLLILELHEEFRVDVVKRLYACHRYCLTIAV